MKDRKERQRHRKKEKQAPRRKPMWDPIPRRGSYPEPKADTCLLYTSDAADDVSWV